MLNPYLYNKITQMEELEQPREKAKGNPFMPLYFALILVVGILVGYFFSFNTPSFAGQHRKSGNTKITSLLEYIKFQYVDTIDEKNLVERTITSLLQGLDPHSDYIPASEFAQVNEPLQGNFDGIGVEFNIINDTIRVISPISGGPSEKIGVKAGDKIIKVEKENVAGVKISNKLVFEKLRGPSGTKVKITVLRSGVPKPIDFTITRDAIPIYSLDVSYMVRPGIGYIKISRFASTTYDEYLKAFNTLSKKGMKKLILDLRGNPGGFLKEAVEIADEFLAGGLQIVYTEGRANPKKIYKATDRGSFENGPLVILVDEGSASASEIVAGAVQDNDRATIIGRRSFGKGLVQDQKELGDGSAVRLTIARYYTPTGRCIQKPYTHGNEAYFNEEVERYSAGELVNIDSVKLDKSKKFLTPGGKVVYGGGGIMPDIFVPLDTARYSPFVNKAFFAGIINLFAFDYVDHHRNELLRKYPSAAEFIGSFTLDEQMINSFYAFAKQKKIEAEDNEREKSAYNLKQLLKAIIGRDLYDKDAYYPIINESDHSIKKAIEVLEKSSYD
jgi:carboxyl-terminal processing protease